MSAGSIAGAIVPHAPLLIPAVGGDSHSDVPAVRAAAADLDPGGVDIVVVLSPHGPRTGVYRDCRGDLSGFGVTSVELERDTDAGAGELLAAEWDVPMLEAPVDHGVLVPLMLMGDNPPAPVIAACLDEGAGAHTGDEAGRFEKALRALPGTRRLLFVASANTSAGLSPRAPLTEIPGALTIEASLRRTLEDDPGKLDGLATQLAEVGGSCSRGPLAVFGALFAGRPARVLAHVWPFGVGYLVATAAR